MWQVMETFLGIWRIARIWILYEGSKYSIDMIWLGGIVYLYASSSRYREELESKSIQHVYERAILHNIYST